MYIDVYVLCMCRVHLCTHACENQSSILAVIPQVASVLFLATGSPSGLEMIKQGRLAEQ